MQVRAPIPSVPLAWCAPMALGGSVDLTNRMGTLLCAAFGAAVFVAPAIVRAGPNGTVQSANIRDADGTTGQDSTRGSGVKTPHLQNLAVTSAKIADGAVTASKLANGAVGTAQLAAGAVVDSKIAGPIAHSKLERYASVAVVAKSGGDYPDPLSALASIATWCGTPSAANPCLIKILPGVYDAAGNSVALPDYVDLEGSGRNLVKISGTGTYGVVVSNGRNEVRSLSIESRGGGELSIAVWNYALLSLNDVGIDAHGGWYRNVGVWQYSPKQSPGFRLLMKDVSVKSSGGEFCWAINAGTETGPQGPIKLVDVVAFAEGGSENVAIRIGGVPSRDDPDGPTELTNVTAIAKSGSFDVALLVYYSSAVSLSNVTAVAPGPTGIAVRNASSTITVRNSSLAASPTALLQLDEGGGLPLTRIAATELGGEISRQHGNLQCAGAFDASFAPVTCP